ncbi:phosphorylase b kinase gamma catalytic chain, skeletal muscle/heart isoform-like [Paramacrobiotus metropolitanus]|uniref:phosphorylase b kinase gamma catalytic chain, skeletal muscle/heart isoform-like n=1 Tax=Paramacrobiotus metropolitanus TaxID=2943436 RepID=UPI002445BFB5|nr:phosphorylase b kinase gamma catalytic chain, skeletal muscle/heart isoform-like [Paramacrobiotus metropolitanus]
MPVPVESEVPPEIIDNSPDEQPAISINEDTSGFQQRYILKEVLGRGACSVVKRCVEKRTQKEFAVKIVDLTTENATEADATEVYTATKNEIAILRLLAGHPHITELHDVFESATFIFLVFELCRKGELFDHMNQVVTLSEKRTRKIMQQLLQVVDFMHKRNVVHRDLKPENILLDDQLNIKVTDFGFAAIIPEGETGGFRDLCGTPGYLAPEVLKVSMYQGQSPYGKEVDLWACGVIMYTLLAGYPPFWHRRQMMMLRLIMEGQYSFSAPEWEDVSEGPKDVIRQLLVVDPAARMTAEQALAHSFFQIGTFVLQTISPRRRMRRTMLMVRCAVRIHRQLVVKPQTKIPLSQIQRDPYRQRVIRKAIDAAAFKIYGHWVRRDEEQNRAAMFQNSVKLEMKLLVKPAL